MSVSRSAHINTGQQFGRTQHAHSVESYFTNLLAVNTLFCFTNIISRAASINIFRNKGHLIFLLVLNISLGINVLLLHCIGTHQYCPRASESKDTWTGSSDTQDLTSTTQWSPLTCKSKETKKAKTSSLRATEKSTLKVRPQFKDEN